ncbi:MAG: protein jag [Firmicutes bacterium]|nr:protein jag [Bacillota bacterium]
MKFAEKWGDSIDIAVELALQDLKLTRDQVTVTVLEQPSRGFLGFGSKLAKVRVEEIAPEKPAKAESSEKPEKAESAEKSAKSEASEKPAEEKTVKPRRLPKEESDFTEKEGEEPASGERRSRRDRRDKSPSSKSRSKSRSRQKAQRKPEPEEEEIDYIFEDLGLMSEKPEDLQPDEENPANQFLKDLFREMGLDVEAKVYSGEGCVYVEVEGPDCGTVIGKRGQTLDSVQYLTSLVVNKGQSKYIRTIIDAEGYRKKRELTLEKLAVRLAEKAKKSGRSVKLEPMNPYERKVIHSVLQKYEGVSTKSEGKEPYRRVIIEPEK